MLRRGSVALAVTAVAASVALAATGCESKKTAGLPPAQDWQSPPEGASAVPPSMPAAAHGGGARIDPHAGVAGAPPLGGSGMGGAAGGDPHAGIPGAPPLGAAGSGHGAGGVDVAAMGLPEPDPNRPI